MGDNWHSLIEKEVITKLNSNINGLSTESALERQNKYGKNELPKSKEPTLLEIFISQFKGAMVIVLIIAAIIAICIGEYIDGIFIVIAILINAILGTYQENSAIKSASSIQKLLKIKAETIRDGNKTAIDSEELVPGDIIILDSGDKVPADIRLLDAHNLQLDESFLTGESVGVIKNIEIVKENAPITERTNLCYASSSVQSGRGMGIVIATGINTEIGGIAEKLVATEDSKSPLTIRMEEFTKQIMYLVLIFAIITSILMITKGYPGQEVFLLIVAMCVSAIPESLPIAQTVVLSIATSVMSRKNVIVKKLSSVESLGSCTIIASDKTGTLTVNQQTAKIVSLSDGVNFSISGEGYNDKGSIELDNANEEQKSNIELICQMGILNNEAFLDQKDNDFVYHGDSIDLAFLSLGLKYGIEEKKLKNQYNITGRIPYESENKFSAVFFDKGKEDHVTVKGSAETILELCSKQMIGDKAVSLDYEKQEKEFLRLSAAGYRVIALATGRYKGKKKEYYEKKDIKNLTFIGFVGFIDPIRNTSKDAIAKCHNAGIRVIMITGDHPLTGKVIAQELDLIDEDSGVITGDAVEDAYNTSKDELIKLVTYNNVFARVSPVQKAIIIETLKELGEFIAVTGDGINDAPALKKANIGVAMGSGTDVAKDVSSMIITDDNFLSIVSAVEEGRHAYNNVRKVTYLLISTAFAEMFLFALTVVFDLPLPFTTVQILWINLVTNGIQDIAIACERSASDLMAEKPRPTNERIFNKLLIKESLLSAVTMFLIVFVVWFLLSKHTDIPIAQARNYILLLMVLLQNVHAFNCRSEKRSAFKIPLRNNKFIVYAVTGALFLHVLFMNVPFLQGILQTNSVSNMDFVIIFLMTTPLLLVMEIFKYFERRSTTNNQV